MAAWNASTAAAMVTRRALRSGGAARSRCIVVIQPRGADRSGSFTEHWCIACPWHAALHECAQVLAVHVILTSTRLLASRKGGP